MLKRIDSKPVSAARAQVRGTLIVRNETLRLPQVLEHHRALGVDSFLVVDNASDDGTLDLLLAQPDVHVFFTDRSFREEKALWRRWLFQEFCEGSWTLNLDADELFVFPDFEELDLHALCGCLDAEGALGMVAPLVDMYASEGLDLAGPAPGASLLETCPFFDATGYLLRYRRRPFAPAFRLEGGPRHRLFFAGGRRPAPLRQRLAAWLYRIDRRAPAPPLRVPGLGPALEAFARTGLVKRTPNLAKLPLLRWSSGLGLRTDLLDALHYVEPPIPISDSWGALLHFKLLEDLRERAREAAGGATRPAGWEYDRYDAVLRGGDPLPLLSEASTRFRSSASLLDAGLMRRGAALAALVRDRRRGAGAERDAAPPRAPA